jgi:hypothetical protein
MRFMLLVLQVWERRPERWREQLTIVTDQVSRCLVDGPDWVDPHSANVCRGVKITMNGICCNS